MDGYHNHPPAWGSQRSRPVPRAPHNVRYCRRGRDLFVPVCAMGLRGWWWVSFRPWFGAGIEDLEGSAEQVLDDRFVEVRLAQADRDGVGAGAVGRLPGCLETGFAEALLKDVHGRGLLLSA